MENYFDGDDDEKIDSFLDSCLFWLMVFAAAIVIGGGIAYFMAVNLFRIPL